MNRKSYPTDLTDAQWAMVVSLIPLAKPGGRPRKTNVRQVLNAILYLFALEVRGICSPMISLNPIPMRFRPTLFNLSST